MLNVRQPEKRREGCRDGNEMEKDEVVLGNAEREREALRHEKG